MCVCVYACMCVCVYVHMCVCAYVTCCKHLAAAPKEGHGHIVGRDGRQQQNELEGRSHHRAEAVRWS